jgi:hypothetical protein
VRFLYFAIHYPKLEHIDDLLGAMHRFAAAAVSDPATEQPLQMAAFRDEASNRIIAVSVWPSRQAFQSAMPRMAPILASTPFDDWERAPREIYALDEATPRS